MKQSYADRVRVRQRERAEKAVTKGGGDPREWTPTDGVFRIRFLPPIPFAKDVFNANGEIISKKGEEDDFFYMTHSYHFLEGIGKSGKGMLLWTPRTFTLPNGRVVKDPIDEAVSHMYETARRHEDDDGLKSIAGKIKRKRQYFANIILYDDNNNTSEFKILKDNTNEGKLIAQVCKHMGFPFYRDVQDEWVVRESLDLDPDMDYVDLVDIKEGHDFKIKRIKSGVNNWDIDYSTSIPSKKVRALTDEEINMYMAMRVDLRNYVTYCTYEDAKSALAEYLNYIGYNDDTLVSSKSSPVSDDDDVPVAKPQNTSKLRPIPSNKEVDDEEEEFDEKLLDELDED